MTGPIGPDRRTAADDAQLDRARAHRREEERCLSMSERLARLHELCRQTTAIAGAARRR